MSDRRDDATAGYALIAASEAAGVAIQGVHAGAKLVGLVLGQRGLRGAELIQDLAPLSAELTRRDPQNDRKRRSDRDADGDDRRCDIAKRPQTSPVYDRRRRIRVSGKRRVSQ